MADYNQLTRKLLAEGYTADNHPDYVRVADANFGHGDPLENLHGGFKYMPDYRRELVFEAPCGLQLLGDTALDNMHWMGIEFSHENDNPVFHCPYSYPACHSCECRPEPFFSSARKDRFCCAHPSTRPYCEEASVEREYKAAEARKEQLKQEFLQTHERACPHQMRYDEWKECWEMKYNPSTCVALGTCSFCTVFQEDLGKAKGNIYYDIELEGRDVSKDGTIFEGERFHSVHKGYQYFSKPVNLKVAEHYLKFNKEFLLYHIKETALSRLIGSMTIFQAERGERDLKWEFKNFRIIRKNVRDLDQDLADIEAGIKITHVLDETKLAKQAKQMRRAKAADARARKLRRLVLSKDLDEFEMRRAIKALGEQEVRMLLKQRSQPKKEPSLVQFSIFDFGVDAVADG